jgi:hypothetical protein
MTKATTDTSRPGDASTGIEDENEPFFKVDEFGRPLPADVVERRKMFKVWERMSPEEFHAYMIEIGTLNPDGSIPDIYYEEYEHGPQRRRV